MADLRRVTLGSSRGRRGYRCTETSSRRTSSSRLAAFSWPILSWRKEEGEGETERRPDLKGRPKGVGLE
jgi:hypothetical protein